MPAPKRVHSKKRRTVPLILWVSPQEKAEVQRLATTDNLSISKTGRALLAGALRQNLQAQHANLLEPIVEQIFRKNMKHMAFLVTRDAFTNEYTKAITINILNNLPGMNQKIVHEIVTRSTDTAKRNMLRRTPQFEMVLQEVERWFQEGNKTPI
jgi:hypothetical protein